VGQTILIVDDDDSIRDLLAAFLGDEGFAVVCATDGAQALELVTDKLVPDLMLLDIGMPVVNGPEFVALYRRICEPPHAPIVVITARGDGERIATEIGADGFVNKPFALEELAAAIARAARPAR
jgi:DNA-binding response OmpR family regulator